MDRIERDAIQFRVQGSAPDPYVIVFARTGKGLAVTCTCAATAMGQMCKHRLSIIDGDDSKITVQNKTDLVQVRDWIAASPIADFRRNLEVAEHEEREAKDRVKQAKRKLALACQGE